MKKAISLQSTITEMNDAQAELHLLRSCAGFCRVNHLLRTVPPDLMVDQLHMFDDALRSTLSTILHSSISDLTWLQANLPFRLGGLGIRDTFRSAPAAYTASLRHSKLMVCPLLSPFLDSSTPLPTFYGEDPSHHLLAVQLGQQIEEVSDSRSSQHSIQALLDELHHDQLASQLAQGPPLSLVLGL